MSKLKRIIDWMQWHSEYLVLAASIVAVIAIMLRSMDLFVAMVLLVITLLAVFFTEE